MKITKLSAFQPATPDSPPDWRTQLGQIIVQVETDDGVVGIGVGGGGRAGIHVIETVLRDLLIGRDASDVEQCYDDMCRSTVFYGRSGLVMMAISGVDLALWDIRGKVADRPVACLLDAQVDLKRPIPTYCTVFDDVATAEALQTGHRAIKLHVERFGDRPDPSRIAELVAKVRDVLGSDGMLMIDAFARWDVKSTLAVAFAIQPYDVAWLEEPITPDDLNGYAELAANSPVAIAGGEHEYGINGFRTLIERKLHAVLQPDINWCGGLTPMIEIYRLAQDAGLRVCPHRGSEPFALQAIAALDQQPLAESPRTWFNCFSGAAEIVDGWIQPAGRPGFGITIKQTANSTL